MNVTVKIVMDIDGLEIKVNAKSNKEIDDPADFLSKAHDVMQELVKDSIQIQGAVKDVL
jgi:hypothetical protein